MDDTPQFAQMQGFLFPFLGSLLFIVLHLIVYMLLVRKVSSSKIIARFLNAILFINMIFSVLYMFMRSYEFAPKWAFMIASICVGVMFMFLVGAIIASCVSLAFWILQKQHLKPKLKRYILAFCFIYGFYALYNGLSEPKIRHISSELNKLSKPLKVLQLSDIHIGGLMDEARVARIVSLSNAQNPDIIAITGDLIDSSLENSKASLQILGNLRAKYGVYYVLGNHEYIHDVYEIIESIKSLGFKVLINENIEIKNIINIAGSADLMGNRMGFLKPDFNKSLKNINANLPVIFLTHQPKVINILDSALLQKIDFILAGHTHGGQIFPISLAVLLQQPYLKGLHKIPETSTYIYVNEGAGFWGPPMRSFSTSEITLFEFLPILK